MKNLKTMRLFWNQIKDFVPKNLITGLKILTFVVMFFFVGLIIITAAFVFKIQMYEKWDAQKDLIIQELQNEKVMQRVYFQLKIEDIYAEKDSIMLLYCPIDLDKEKRLKGDFEPNQAGTLIK